MYGAYVLQLGKAKLTPIAAFALKAHAILAIDHKPGGSDPNG